jgi:hypothetical protein
VKDVAPSVVMIGGTGRSGSNLLKNALGQMQGAVVLPFEARFAVDPDGLLPSYRALRQPITPFEANRVLTRLAKLLRRLERKTILDRAALLLEFGIERLGLGPINLLAYKEWELEMHAPGYGAAVSQLMQELEAGRYGGIWPGQTGWRRFRANRIAHPPNDPKLHEATAKFLHKVFQSICAKSDADIYIADDTFSLFFAPEWQSLWPDMKFVHVVRDPRDVVASLMRQRWAPPNLDEALVFYASTMGAMRNALGELPIEDVKTLRLEDLVADPKGQLQKLCAALRLPYSNKMETLDFSRGNVGRWRDEISQSEHARLNAALALDIERFEYAPN